MQISSLALGGNLPPAAPPEPMERKEPLPMEKNDSTERVQNNLADNKKPPNHDLQQTTLDLEQISLAFNRRLKFVIDQDSKQIIVKVIDNETDKVIKVLPPEELQRLHSRIRETIGFLFDRMV